MRSSKHQIVCAISADAKLDEGITIESLISPLHDPSSDKMEDKRGALIDILKMIREDSPSLWNSFPKVFEALIKAVDDVQVWPIYQ